MLPLAHPNNLMLNIVHVRGFDNFAIVRRVRVVRNNYPIHLDIPVFDVRVGVIIVIGKLLKMGVHLLWPNRISNHQIYASGLKETISASGEHCFSVSN